MQFSAVCVTLVLSSFFLKGQLSSDLTAPWSRHWFQLVLCKLVNSVADFNPHTGLRGWRLTGFPPAQTLAEEVEAAQNGGQEHEGAWRWDGYHEVERSGEELITIDRVAYHRRRCLGRCAGPGSFW